MASFFREPGDAVVTTEGRTRNSNQRYAHKWACVLNDHMRAVLVGERTYGNGVVQSTCASSSV